MSDPNKVWPTGLTEPEAQELHRNIIQGTQIFGAIAAFAHLLARFEASAGEPPAARWPCGGPIPRRPTRRRRAKPAPIPARTGA